MIKLYCVIEFQLKYYVILIYEEIKIKFHHEKKILL